MTDRHDRTGIADTEARCSPASPCRQSQWCARVQATIPQGCAVEDFGRLRSAPTDACARFLPVRARLQPVELQAPVKPWPVGVK